MTSAVAVDTQLARPRFEVGDFVRCRKSLSTTEWVVGTVKKQLTEWGPYHVKLDDGRVCRVPMDDDQFIQRADQVIQHADFWESPLGKCRRRFEAQCGVRWQQGQRKLQALGSAVPVVPHQLKHNIEQFEHLVSKGVLDSDVHEYVTDIALPAYRRALEAADSALTGSQQNTYVLHNRPEFEAVLSLHQKALYLDPGDVVAGDAIQAHDFDALEREFQEKEHHAIVIDDFFSQEALAKLRDYLLDSTFWMDAKSGYMATFAGAGFASPLVAQIDQELRSKFPNVIGGLELQNCWAFMFDGSMGGVRTHADDAQVQINFFMTPTEANEWSEDDALPTGGLVVYGVGPPEGWSLIKINEEDDESKEHILASTGHWNVTVPYVQNRAVLFDSSYFHRTDNMKFKKGYKNRRINMTFLYGKRAHLKPAATMTA